MAGLKATVVDLDLMQGFMPAVQLLLMTSAKTKRLPPVLVGLQQRVIVIGYREASMFALQAHWVFESRSFEMNWPVRPRQSSGVDRRM